MLIPSGWFYLSYNDGLQLTKTISRGENASLSVRRRSGYNPQWRRISDGIVTNLTAYDGMDTITIPPDQAKHGDVYAVVQSSQALGDNKFTLIRLIVRGR